MLAMKFRELGLAFRSEITMALNAFLTNPPQDFGFNTVSESLLLEVPSVNGILKWKIDNFESAKNDAQNEKIISIYSPYFYFGKEGYKMRLRLDPNGSNEGKNSHMSLFLLILKGEFDDKLTWPLILEVKFTLMNAAQGEIHTYTFRPDPFPKPTTDSEFDGYKAGYSQFIAHDYIPAYIKDDMIFIKCEVN